VAAKTSVPTILDIEASGFGHGSYPIEVGVVTDGGDSYCSLICPEPEWLHWDAEAEATHNISRQHLLDHGRDVRTVAVQLNEMLDGHTVYSDAWGHDMSWLGLLYHHAGIKQGFRIESLSVLLSEEQMAIWDRTKQQVITDLELSRHRASSDALVIQQTYLQTLQGIR